MKKLYKRIGFGRTCPNCVQTKVTILLEIETGKYFDKCSSCNRTWDSTHSKTVNMENKTQWPYDKRIAHQYDSLTEQATHKQIGYILNLSERNKDGDEMLNSIMDSIPEDLDVEDLTKGQAMYVIKCLLGEIKPIKENEKDS